MSRCADPTCWPIEHDYSDHTYPSGRIRRWLERGTLREPERPAPVPEAKPDEPVQEGLGLA